jgi:hypothetical protein
MEIVQPISTQSEEEGIETGGRTDKEIQGKRKKERKQTKTCRRKFSS